MNEISAFLAGSVLMVLTLNLLRRFIRWINQPNPYVIRMGDLISFDSNGRLRKVISDDVFPVGVAIENGETFEYIQAANYKLIEPNLDKIRRRLDEGPL